MISDCCGATVYDDTDICSDCYEHCEVIDDESLDEVFGTKEFEQAMKIEGKTIIQNNQVERSKKWN